MEKVSGLLCYHWDQEALGIAGPLDDVILEDLEQRLVTVVKVPAKASQCTCQAIHPHAWSPQPCPGTASSELRIGDAEFAPGAYYIVVYPTSSAALTGRTSEAA